MDNLKESILRARGSKKADLVLKNCKIINTFTGEILDGDVALYKDTILGIGDYTGQAEIDLDGKFLVPGLIDSHVHIESSMVSPVEFGKTLIKHGVTTIIADPHEIANVKGIAGIEYIIEDSQYSPVDVLVNLPSCVPATPFETSGAILNSQDLIKARELKNTLGLGELMNYPGVLNLDNDILKKIQGFKDTIIDGHGPGLSGKDLNAYILAGVKTDHEASTVEEVLEKIRNGMYILVREGSVTKDLRNIIRAVNKDNLSMFLMCTDDKHPRDLIADGSIDHNIRLAIKSGIDPIDAIKMSTINSARCYSLKNKGAIAPGYLADLIVLDSLEDFKINSVIKSGKLLVKDGQLLEEYTGVSNEEMSHSLNIPKIGPKDLEIPLKQGLVNIIGMKKHSVITEKETGEVLLENGNYKDTEGINRLYVIERHHNTGNIGKALISNYGLKNGAVGTTIGHDSHNLIVTGDNIEDILLVIEEIKKNEGGIALAHRGQVLGSLRLDIGGLMSSDKIENVVRDFNILMDTAYEKLGINKDIDPFMSLCFMALAVIPSIKLTDQGLFDVEAFDFISLEVE